jgi:hypothetical protein
MTSMNYKTFISISFLLFLSCQFIAELKHKDDIVSEAYVNNPNGLALYKTKGDLKSKEVVLKPEEKFYFLEKSNEDVKESWRKVLYGGKELFAYGAGYSSDLLEFRKLESEESRFGVLEKETILRELPFDKTKELEKIPAFSVVEIIAIEKRSWKNYSVKVKIENSKIGFIETEISQYKTEEVAKKNSISETIREEGYFLVTTKEAVFLSIESMLPIDKVEYETIEKKGNLLFVNYCKKIDGVRYYSYYSRSKMPFFTGSPSILISESNGKFLSEKEFTEYTIQNTNFNGDKRIIEQIKNIDSHFANFLNFKVTKLASDIKNGTYYLATVRKGMTNRNNSYLLKEYNSVYSSLEIQGSFGIEEVKTFDLDNDGILEILSLGQERGSAYYELFGMKRGKYQVIASFSTDTKFFKDVIYVNDDFSEYLPSKDGSAYSNSKTYSPRTKLKYQKGKLIKIK